MENNHSENFTINVSLNQLPYDPSGQFYIAVGITSVIWNADGPSDDYDAELRFFSQTTTLTS